MAVLCPNLRWFHRLRFHGAACSCQAEATAGGASARLGNRGNRGNIQLDHGPDIAVLNRRWTSLGPWHDCSTLTYGKKHLRLLLAFWNSIHGTQKETLNVFRTLICQWICIANGGFHCGSPCQVTCKNHDSAMDLSILRELQKHIFLRTPLSTPRVVDHPGPGRPRATTNLLRKEPQRPPWNATVRRVRKNHCREEIQ